MKRILGMGNALTDILLQIDNDNILSELALPKGSMQLIDETKAMKSRRSTAFFILKRRNQGTNKILMFLNNSRFAQVISFYYFCKAFEKTNDKFFLSSVG